MMIVIVRKGVLIMENMKRRDIKKTWTVNARRVSPIHTAGAILEPGHWQEFDPFLLLMEDQFSKGAFDFHPHRGIETITYIIDGRINHYDNATGAGGTLVKGDFQFMTAGKGVIHNESPEEGDNVHLLQLWVNLPRKHKMTEPRYQNMHAKDMPVRQEKGAMSPCLLRFIRRCRFEYLELCTCYLCRNGIRRGSNNRSRSSWKL